MQAIARVNRVFRDKPGGLVVDYLGLAHELKRALASYTESEGTGRTTVDQSEAVAVMLEKYEVCRALFHGFDHSRWIGGTEAEQLSLLPGAQEHLLAQEDGKARCLRSVRELSRSLRPSRSPCLTRRRSGSATTWRSSRPFGRCWPSAPKASRARRRSDESVEAPSGFFLRFRM